LKAKKDAEAAKAAETKAKVDREATEKAKADTQAENKAASGTTGLLGAFENLTGIDIDGDGAVGALPGNQPCRAPTETKVDSALPNTTVG